jgi:hypothetical protein
VVERIARVGEVESIGPERFEEMLTFGAGRPHWRCDPEFIEQPVVLVGQWVDRDQREFLSRNTEPTIDAGPEPTSMIETVSFDVPAIAARRTASETSDDGSNR